MQKVLKKRILRDLKENLVRYLALGAMIILCMYIIISLIGTADSIIIGSENNAQRNHLEDGQFTVFVSLTEEQKEELESKGVTLEEQFYLDYQLEDESTLRVFQNREKINTVEVENGRLAESNGEIVLEKRYAEEHALSVGDTIILGGKEFEITGIGCSPDYDAPYKAFTDSSINSVQFGTAFVGEDTYEQLLAEGKSVKAEEYVYSYLLSDSLTDAELKDELQGLKVSAEISNLTQFIKVVDNPRAGAAAGDQLINKYGGLIAGIIILVLFAYVNSVFVIYGIEKENMTIGALYALGIKKNELIFHYLCLPVAVTFLAGTIGCLIGFGAIGDSTIMGSTYTYFSIPHMETIYPSYLLVYGLVLPPVIFIVVNWLVIRKKLNKPALQMLRNEQKESRISNINLGSLGFISRFRIRQMLREARTSLTVIGGMYISLLILMLGLNCYNMCRHISEDNKEDTKFEYLYTYKYPEETVPEGGYEAFSKGMKKENLGYNLDVTILGITEENPFFDVNLTDSKSEVVISSAMAEKYAIKPGEVVVLNDEDAEMNYAFTVKEIAQYSTSFYVFMDQMRPMISMMIGCAILIFAVVMYLMMKVMIDRCAFHISMVKVFGYRDREIKKLYLNGNFYVIAVGAVICIPLAKKCMDFMYPVMVCNVACAMNLKFSWQMYVMIYAGILVTYFAINELVVGRLKKVNLAEVLKNRE